MKLAFSQDRQSATVPLLVLAAATIHPLASAEFITSPWPFQNTSGYRPDEFPDWNRSPNATALIPVVGWDLTKPYPGLWEGSNQQSDNQWTLQLNITANVTGTDDRVPVTRISTQLRPPPGSLFDAETGNWSVPEDVTSYWKIFLLTFGEKENDRANVSANSINQGSDPQRSCEGFMSDDCMSNMRKVVQQSVNVIAWGDTDFPLKVYKADGCPPWGPMTIRELSLNNSFTRQTSYYRQEPEDGGSKYASGYDYYGTRMYASMLIWTYSNKTLVPGEFNVGRDSLADDHITFMCARVNQTVGDSRLPGEGLGSSRAAGGMRAPSLGTLMLVIGLGVMLQFVA